MLTKILTFIILFNSLLFSKTVIAQTIKYDELDRVTEIIYPDSTITRYAYDATGNRISQVTTTPVVTSVPTIDPNIATLRVFPNPTPTDVTIELQLLRPDNVTIACYTLEGRLLFQEQHKNIRTLIKPFRLSGKPTGIYTIIITTSKGKQVRKIEKL